MLESSYQRCFFSMLEIGVGTGRFAMHFPDIIGVDPSVNALRIAKRRGLKTLQADGEDLPFDDKTFKGRGLATLQRPSGFIQMRTIDDTQIMTQQPSEKSTLFRDASLLPEISSRYVQQLQITCSRLCVHASHNLIHIKSAHIQSQTDIST